MLGCYNCGQLYHYLQVRGKGIEERYFPWKLVEHLESDAVPSYLNYLTALL